MFKKVLFAACTLLSLLQFTACRCTNATVIYDLDADKKVYLETEYSGWIEVVAFIDKDKKTFKTLQRFGGNSMQKERTLRMRTFDINGRMLAQQILPFDFEYWAIGEYKFSLDGEKIVYYNHPSKSLNLYNIATGKHELLIPDIASSGVCVDGIFFINDDEFVCFLGRDEDVGRLAAQCLSCNIKAKKWIVRHDKLDSISISQYDTKISKNKKTIVFPSPDLNPSIVLLDTETFKLKTVQFSNLGYVQSLEWDGNEKIAVGREYINIYDLKTGKTETIFKMKKDFIISELFFLNHNKLLAIGWFKGDSGSCEDFYLIDIQKKEMIRSFSLTGRNWAQIDDHTLLYDTICWFWF